MWEDALMRRPWLEDPDVTLYLGDVVEVLAGLPDGSVDCCVTSPPYWGLRDYGTIGQIGLEDTPDAYVARMVIVFREVRRVLAPYGTCWVNLGDSYASAWACNRRNVVGAGSLENGKRDARPDRLVDGLKEKDLVGIPWRVAFALQADGWWLRSDVIWSKSNPMPESVTDRPTKSHEYVFLLTKQPRYFFDQEAVREPAEWARWGDQTNGKHEGGESAASWIGAQPKADIQQKARGGGFSRKYAEQQPAHGAMRLERPADTGTRNIRSVWDIATQPYPEAHFATYPEELVRRCVLAGCPELVCRTCGKPRDRIVEREQPPEPEHRQPGKRLEPGQAGNVGEGNMGFRASRLSGQEMNRWRAENPGIESWSDCGHNDYRPGVVLDPFAGSGTTCLVARKHGRRSIGIDLNEQYLELAARRLQQLSLLTEAH